MRPFFRSGFSSFLGLGARAHGYLVLSRSRISNVLSALRLMSPDVVLSRRPVMYRMAVSTLTCGSFVGVSIFQTLGDPVARFAADALYRFTEAVSTHEAELSSHPQLIRDGAQMQNSTN